MSLGLYSMREAWESTSHDPPRQAPPTCSGPAHPLVSATSRKENVRVPLILITALLRYNSRAIQVAR